MNADSYIYKQGTFTVILQQFAGLWSNRDFKLKGSIHEPVSKLVWTLRCAKFNQ